MRSNYINCLPGVPAVESPFFEELFDKADPHYETALALRENGFAVVDFPEPELERMIDRIKIDLRPDYSWKDWDAGKDADMRIMDAWKYNKDVRRIATNRHSPSKH